MAKQHKAAQRCENCRFFKPLDRADGDEGECHRHAPSPTIDHSGKPGEEPMLYTYWPEIEPDNWCGDFEISWDEEAKASTTRKKSASAGGGQK